MLSVTLYEYQAIITSVYDGDTVRADIDCGFHVWKRGEHLRLMGINSPELRGETRDTGLRARDALRERILGKPVWLKTEKPSVTVFPAGADMRDKYGRYLATIWDADGDVNAWMIEQGHAVSYLP
ncbi:MAG: thermonuclease family protein [Gemmatimonadaceae bacterium]|nr:thermonuclease family protein [Gemmatimonadaceae bacterium]